MRRVAVFGGSFNPPHVSHVLAVAYVLATQEIDEVLVMPTFGHPFGKTLASFEHRVAMCDLAFRHLRNVSVSRLEGEMGGESKTLYTLRKVKETHPDWSLQLVVGTDILRERHKWFAWDEVVAIAPLIVLARVGFPASEASVSVLPEAASRDIRAAMGKGEDVGSLVDRDVIAYAETHGLYREAT